MKLINVLSIFLVLVLSCKTQKPLAPIAYPCPPVSESITRIDTVTEVKFTPQYVEKTVIKEVEGKQIEIKTVDTLYIQSESKILYRTKTVEIENTSKVLYAQYQKDSIIQLLNQCIKENNALQSKYDQSKGGSRTKNILLGSMMLLLLLIIGFGIWLSKKSKIPF